MNITTPVGTLDLPDSVHTPSNTHQVIKTYVNEAGEDCELTITIRWDDCCGNGQNSFAVTANEVFYEVSRGYERKVESFSGMCHELIAQRAPELAHALPFHLFDSRGPMHYFANTAYLAGDRDCWGQRKGEQKRNKAGLPMWHVAASPGFPLVCAETKPDSIEVPFEPVVSKGKERDLETAQLCWEREGGDKLTEAQWCLPEKELLELLKSLHPQGEERVRVNAAYYARNTDEHGLLKGQQSRDKSGTLRWKTTGMPYKQVDSATQPEPLRFDYEPLTGEGKARELVLARRAACWPEATDEELSQPLAELNAALAKRLPELMQRFKAVVEGFGFVY